MRAGVAIGVGAGTGEGEAAGEAAGETAAGAVGVGVGRVRTVRGAAAVPLHEEREAPAAQP